MRGSRNREVGQRRGRRPRICSGHPALISECGRYGPGQQQYTLRSLLSFAWPRSISLPCHPCPVIHASKVHAASTSNLCQNWVAAAGPITKTARGHRQAVSTRSCDSEVATTALPQHNFHRFESSSVCFEEHALIGVISRSILSAYSPYALTGPLHPDVALS